MAKKGGSFWDNPFGGMFDLNHDGREDIGEQWLAFKIFEECTKENDSSAADNIPSSSPWHSDNTDLHEWRTFCEDGSDVGIDPLDFETEQEYNQAIYDKKYAWRRWASYSARKYGIDPTAFESEDDFNAAVEEARKTEQQKRCGEQTMRQQFSRTNYRDPLAQTDKTVYTFCGVMFEGSPAFYHYRTDDDSITIGDLVIVPGGQDGKEAIVEVVTVQKHRRATAPYPVDRAKFIKGKYEG